MHYFDHTWLKAVSSALVVIQKEQKGFSKETVKTNYRFLSSSGKPHPAIRMQGYGYPGKKIGLVRNVFRPSDDESVFPYLIPANAMAVVTLKNVAKILTALSKNTLAGSARTIANNIDSAIKNYGIVKRNSKKIFAYEVDGFGSQYIMDDPNIPSLLSLPYLGYCTGKNPTYQETRKIILSNENPFYAKGKNVSGLTSPHTGLLDYCWPMATIMQALTSDDKTEIATCLQMLKKSHAGTYFMHESVNVDNPKKYTRPWFCWANSLFGELILAIEKKYPELL